MNRPQTSRRKFGYMVPGAILGLILAINTVPVAGGSMVGGYIWIAAIIVGGVFGEACSLFRERRRKQSGLAAGSPNDK